MSSGIRLMRNLPIYVFLAALALLPLLGSFMPYLEGSLWPVVSDFKVLSVKPGGTGVDIEYTYTKQRLCQLVGYSAKVNGVDTVLVPIGENAMLGTRGLGPEAPRTWRLVASGLDGVEIWIIYRCNVLYLTVQKLYPSG